MATRAQLEAALVNADAAGDSDAVTTLSGAIKALKPESTALIPTPDILKPVGSAIYDAMPWFFNKAGPRAIASRENLARLAAEGGSFGAADKYAHLMGGGSPEEERAKTAAAASAEGVLGTAAELMGSLIPTLAIGGGVGKGVAKAAEKLPEVAAKIAPVLNSAIPGLLASGGAQGGAEAFGHDQNSIEGILKGTALAGMFGVGGKVAGKTAGLFFPGAKRATSDTIRAAKDAAYKKVEDTGVKLRASTVDDILAGLDDATKDAYAPLHPKTLATKEKIRQNFSLPIRDKRTPVRLEEIDDARKYISKNVANSIDPAEAGYGQDMLRAIDTRLDNIGVNDVIPRSGDPALGLGALRDARAANSRMIKMKQLDEATLKAERRSARTRRGDIDNATRSNIDQILSNKKKVKGFTPDEQAAMDAIVRGSTMQNTLTKVGHLAPSLTLGGMGGMGIAGTIGGAMGGPAGALAAMGATGGTGYVAKKMAERKSARTVDALYDLVAAGGKKSAVKQVSKSAVRKALDSDMLNKVLTTWGVTN